MQYINKDVFVSSPSRQHKLEEALLFSGQFAEALQALVDWLYRVEPQLAEDLPVHGDLDLVSNLMDSHKVYKQNSSDIGLQLTIYFLHLFIY